MKKNPCKGLKVERPNNDLSDMFIETLMNATDKSEEGVRQLFNFPRKKSFNDVWR